MTGHGTPLPLTFIIRPVPPFRLDLTAWALRRRAHNVIDRWDGSSYRRVIRLGGRPADDAHMGFQPLATWRDFALDRLSRAGALDAGAVAAE